MSSVPKGKSVADGVAEETLGQKIRKRRRAIDMTLQQVSERVGLSIGFLSQIERGMSAGFIASALALDRRRDDLGLLALALSSAATASA